MPPVASRLPVALLCALIAACAPAPAAAPSPETSPPAASATAMSSAVATASPATTARTPTPTPSPSPTAQPVRRRVTAKLPYANANGVIAADLCARTKAGTPDKSRVLILLVGIGGEPPKDPASSCTTYDAQSWQTTARGMGFDVYVVSYEDPDGYTQRQALAVVELITQLRAERRITPDADVAVVGLSWGGLIARYALQYMETHGPPHDVDLWLTADSPLQGAYVPIGIQALANYLADDLKIAAAKTSREQMLDSPAARQLLLYHYTRVGQEGSSWTADYTRLFRTELADALGGFPRATGMRRVAVSDGRGDGRVDAPAPGRTIFAWRSASVDVTGKGDALTPFDRDGLKVTAKPNGSKWDIVLTFTAFGIEFFRKSLTWAVTARMEIAAFAQASGGTATVFDGRPKFTLAGRDVDLLDTRSVSELLSSIVSAELPGITRGIWDAVGSKAMSGLADTVVAQVKENIKDYPWLGFRSTTVTSAYSYDGGPGGRSDKSGVVADLIGATGGTFTATTVRSHSFIPIHSALMLSNKPGTAIDAASIAAGRGERPVTPFDHVVFAVENRGHLDAKASLIWPTITSELTSLVRRGSS